MKRNELTTANLLKPGDRFYKAADKKKMPLEMVEHSSKQTAYRTYKYWFCPASILDNPAIDKQLKERQFTPINHL